MQRLCFGLDLRPDPLLVDEYIRLHQEVWPEIKKSIHDAGVLDMQIYRLDYRLFMIMEVTDEFTLERKAAMDTVNPKVVEWETLMGKFQQVDEQGDPTKRWQLMDKIFQLI